MKPHFWWVFWIHRVSIGSIHGIFANISQENHPKYPNVGKYMPYMDPMGYEQTQKKQPSVFRIWALAVANIETRLCRGLDALCPKLEVRSSRRVFSEGSGRGDEAFILLMENILHQLIGQMSNIAFLTGFHTRQVVQDFSRQQYSVWNSKFNGNPKPSFLGVITHILGVLNLRFSWFWGPNGVQGLYMEVNYMESFSEFHTFCDGTHMI